MPIIISYDTSTSTKERWGYWLHEDNSSVYKTPLSESDFNDINYFVKDMSISIGYSGDMHPLIPVKCTHLLNYQFDKVILFFLNCLLLTRFYALCELPCL